MQHIFVFRYQILCDVRFEADDGKIVIEHVNVLIVGSPYFRAMFCNFHESNKDFFDIRKIDSAIYSFIDYIYTGEIMVTKENVQV